MPCGLDKVVLEILLRFEVYVVITFVGIGYILKILLL